MESNKIIEAIGKEIGDINTFFVGCEIKEKLGKFIEKGTRFSRLVEWIDEELKYHKNIVKALHPAQVNEDYTRNQFDTALNSLKDIGLLVLSREILLSYETSQNEREAIERRLTKYYKIHYNEMLECYIGE